MFDLSGRFFVLTCSMPKTARAADVKAGRRDPISTRSASIGHALTTASTPSCYKNRDNLMVATSPYFVAFSKNFTSASRSAAEPIVCSGILVPGVYVAGPTSNSFATVSGVHTMSMRLSASEKR